MRIGYNKLKMWILEAVKLHEIEKHDINKTQLLQVLRNCPVSLHKDKKLSYDTLNLNINELIFMEDIKLIASETDKRSAGNILLTKQGHKNINSIFKTVSWEKLDSELKGDSVAGSIRKGMGSIPSRYINFNKNENN